MRKSPRSWVALSEPSDPGYSVPGNISTARSGIFWSQTDFFASGGELFPDPTVYVLSAAMPKGVAVDTQAGAVTD